MNNINLLTIKGVTAVQSMHDRIMDVKTLLEQRLNLDEYTENVRPITLNFSVVLRLCLLAGLSDKSPRSLDDITDYNITISRTPYATTFFTKSDIGSMFETLLKLRYHFPRGNCQLLLNRLELSQSLESEQIRFSCGM